MGSHHSRCSANGMVPESGQAPRHSITSVIGLPARRVRVDLPSPLSLNAGKAQKRMQRMNIALLDRAPLMRAQPFDLDAEDLREALGTIARRLHRGRTLEE